MYKLFGGFLVCYYDLRIFYKNGSKKSIHYSLYDFIKALHHAYRLHKSCMVVFVVDGVDHHICYDKDLSGVDDCIYDERAS